MANEAEEIRKSYQDALVGVSRLIGSSLIVIFLLTVVVEHELFDRRLTITRYKSKIEEQQTKLANAERWAGRQLRLIHETSLASKITITETARESISQAEPKTEPKILTELIQKLEYEHEALKQLNQSSDKQSGEKQKVQNQLGDLSVTLDILKRLKQELPKVAIDKTDIKNQILKFEAALDKIEESSDQKIPTPFGTFETHPRLGLLFLAFASIGAYLAFAAAEAGVIGLALSISKLNEPSKPQMKFWLFPLDPRLPKKWQKEEGKKVLASIILHVAWLLLGTMLILECVRWNKVDPHWLGALWLINIALWVGISIQALFVIRRVLRLLPLRAVAWTAPYVQWLEAHLTRRQVLIWTAASIALLLTGRWIWSKLSLSAGLPVQGKDLVGNTATGVIHHRRICASHLPKQKNQTSGNNLPGRARIHKSQAINIYEALASVSNDDDAARYLELAIQQSPTSLHLYDRLVRVYGRQRLYEKISTVLQSGLDRMQKGLAKSGLNSRQQKALQRTIAALEARVTYAQRRAEANKR